MVLGDRLVNHKTPCGKRKYTGRRGVATIRRTRRSGDRRCSPRQLPCFLLKLVRAPSSVVAARLGFVHQFSRMVARGGQPKPPPRLWRWRWAIAQAALHLGECLIRRSSRNGSGVVIAKNAGQPAVRRPPCASQLCAISATRTGLPARAVVAHGSRDDSRPCPIPCSRPETVG
jgi:hypothetical protein